MEEKSGFHRFLGTKFNFEAPSVENERKENRTKIKSYHNILMEVKNGGFGSYGGKRIFRLVLKRKRRDKIFTYLEKRMEFKSSMRRTRKVRGIKEERTSKGRTRNAQSVHGI